MQVYHHTQFHPVTLRYNVMGWPRTRDLQFTSYPRDRIFSAAPACSWKQKGRRDHTQRWLQILQSDCGSTGVEPRIPLFRRTLYSMHGHKHLPLSTEPHTWCSTHTLSLPFSRTLRQLSKLPELHIPNTTSPSGPQNLADFRSRGEAICILKDLWWSDSTSAFMVPKIKKCSLII